ncbi:MAG: Pyrroline-5-carboxylate reductase [Candidatus Hinthialibacteria bacterium OLB16]|nr:MAG: Pyrroline-5-carboxylate reductase [Candidatus Hinthialibacteria bacterium OLB16]
MACRYGFIGGGNMAAALIRGILGGGICLPENILASDVSSERLELLAAEHGILTTRENRKVAQEAECLVLAVKPQIFPAVAQDIAGRMPATQSVISIMAGVTCQALSSSLQNHPGIVRTMPNLPATLGCGVSGIAETGSTSPKALQDAESLLSTVGATVRLPEDKLDAVTALSGSGPGYLFRIAEILIQAGGVGLGLTEDQGGGLVQHTFQGAAGMLIASSEPAGEFVPPGLFTGRHHTGRLKAMEDNGLQQALFEGVRAACRRSRELSGG